MASQIQKALVKIAISQKHAYESECLRKVFLFSYLLLMSLKKILANFFFL